MLREFAARFAAAPPPPREPLAIELDLAALPQPAAPEVDFRVQYHALICSRLARVRALLDCPARGLAQLEERSPSRVVAHVFRKMQRFPSILKELERPEYYEVDYRPPQQLFSPDDPVFAEDESAMLEVELAPGARCQHLGPLTLGALAMGCVLVFEGVLRRQAGKFLVTAVEFPPLRLPRPVRPSEHRLLLLSGLNLVADTPAPAVAALSAFLATPMPTFSTLVLFGGCVASVKELHIGLYGSYLGEEAFDAARKNFTKSCAVVDALLTRFLQPETHKQLRRAVLAPAATDPHPGAYPQRAFPRAIFPRAAAAGLVRVGNPAALVVDGLRLLLLDGLGVRDLMRQNSLSFEENCKLCVLSRVLLPTCPNTLDGLPLQTDALVLAELPHVVVVGNAEAARQFAVEQGGQRLLFVLVPPFPQAALLDLRSLTSTAVAF